MLVEVPSAVQYLQDLAERLRGMRDVEAYDDALNELQVERDRLKREQLRSVIRRRLWLLPPGRA